MNQIIVAGMHRSGTSLITRLINMLGVYVGGTESMLPAGPDNPSGYWERWDVMTVNDALLSARGCTWDNVAAWCETPSSRRSAPWRLRRIVSELNGHCPWLMKDPRLCLTLGHWAPLLDSPVVVVVYRDPRHIARSLQRRDGMPPSYALALWEFYSVSLLEATRSLRCIHVAAADAVKEPVSFVRSLLASLEAREIDGLHAPPHDEVLQFVAPHLHHSADQTEPLTGRQQHLVAMLKGTCEPREPLRVSEETMTILSTRRA